MVKINKRVIIIIIIYVPIFLFKNNTGSYSTDANNFSICIYDSMNNSPPQFEKNLPAPVVLCVRIVATLVAGYAFATKPSTA